MGGKPKVLGDHLADIYAKTFTPATRKGNKSQNVDYDAALRPERTLSWVL